MTIGAVKPVVRNEATNVVVFPWRNGTLSTSRLPFNQRPRGRVIFVFNQVSSMNTNFFRIQVGLASDPFPAFFMQIRTFLLSGIQYFFIVSFNAFNAWQSVLLEIPILN